MHHPGGRAFTGRRDRSAHAIRPEKVEEGPPSTQVTGVPGRILLTNTGGARNSRKHTVALRSHWWQRAKYEGDVAGGQKRRLHPLHSSTNSSSDCSVRSS